VFSDEAGEHHCWGFFDPDWRDPDGTRGQFRINVESPTGHGGTGGDRQTMTFSAPANRPKWILNRIQKAVRFAFEEGRRVERQAIIDALRRESRCTTQPAAVSGDADATAEEALATEDGADR